MRTATIALAVLLVSFAAAEAAFEYSPLGSKADVGSEASRCTIALVSSGQLAKSGCAALANRKGSPHGLVLAYER